MYLLPKTTIYEIKWTFTPVASRHGCRIRVYDTNDTLITDSYLLMNQPGHKEREESITLCMNGVGNAPAPWRIDCGPAYAVEAASVDAFNKGVQNLALLGPRLSDLYDMEPLIPLS